MTTQTTESFVRRAARKIGSWLVRYGLAEFCGTVSVLLGTALAYRQTDSDVVAGYVGALSENLGFYSIMLLRDARADRRRHGVYGAAGLLRTLRNLAVEFGPAEVLDTGLTRPLAIGLGAHFVGRRGGVLLGKLLGDLLFYIPVVMTYEIRLWMRRRRS